MNTNDLQLGFDPTSSTTITGAQLGTLVTSATPSSDRGMVLLTTDQAGVPVIPDAVGTPAFQRYLWVRVSPTSSSTSVYVWNPNQVYNLAYTNAGTPVVVSTNWNPITLATIPAGSIQGYMIANATIPATALAGGISLAQINGSSSLLTTSTTPTAGDITNTSSFAAGFTIAPLAVTGAKIAAQTIAASNIIPATLTPSTLAPSGVAKVKLTDLLGTTPAWTAMNAIETGLPTPDAGGANDSQLLAVNSGAAGTFKYVAPNSLLKLLQTVCYSVNTTQNQNTTVMVSDASSSLTTSQQLFSFGAAAFTTTVTNSKIKVRVTLSAFTTSNVPNWFGLYDGAAFVAFARLESYGVNFQGQVTLNYLSGALASGTSKTYSVYFGSTNGTAANLTINKSGEGCFMEIQEII